MARVKQQKGERLDDEHVKRAKEYYDKILAEKGTKKEANEVAAGIMNIKVSPPRIVRIFEEYAERLATAARLRKANRSKPITDFEVQAIIHGALDGEPISSIAADLYRAPSAIKNVIERVGIPQKAPGNYHERRFQSSIPDQCMAESFDQYEIVWSDKYNGMAIVLGTDDSVHIYVIERIEEEAPFAIGGKVYRGHGGFHAWQRPEELGSLKHLEKYGVDLYRPYRESFPNWLKG